MKFLACNLKELVDSLLKRTKEAMKEDSAETGSAEEIGNSPKILFNFWGI